VEDRNWRSEETQPAHLSEILEKDLFSSFKGDYAIPLNQVANIFNFTVNARRPIELQAAGTGEVALGIKCIYGTLSLVTSDPNTINNPFNMKIYRHEQHFATVRDILFVSFQREYSLIDRYIYEGDYTAGALELIQ